MSGFTYKGIDIGNHITSHDSNAATFSNYNLQHTTTSYDYQKPLDFNLSDGGSSLHHQCTAAQTIHNNDATSQVVPEDAKSVRLLMRSGQGGKGGSGGHAKATASDGNSNGTTSSAKGNGGNGALGGWNTTSLTNAISISEASTYAITIGTVGNTGNTGSNKTTKSGTTTAGTGGTGGQGGTSSITFYNGNTPPIIVDVSGGLGGPGGNPGTAKSNGAFGKTNSKQGNTGPQPVQPDQTTTANGGSPPSGHPDIDPDNPTGFVQIVWLYD